MDIADFKRHRQRGALLLDSILALAVIGSVLTIGAIIIDQEGKRQENILIASGLKTAIEASQRFLAENYEDILIDLNTSSQERSDSKAIMVLSMADLSDAGYLNQAFLNEENHLRNIFNQNTALLIRGVESQASGFPLDSLTEAEITDPIDGSMAIESILVSYGGNPIPPQRGGLIVSATGLLNAGFMVDEFEARGALSGFQFQMGGPDGSGPYNDFAEYPGEGRFASLISLSDMGVLGFGFPDDADDAFRRCADINRIEEPEEYRACLDTLSGQRVYSDIVMNPRTVNGELLPPALRNLSHITCNEDMGRALDTGLLSIDCSEVTFSGDINIGGGLTIQDNLTTPSLSGVDGSLLLDGNPSQNLYDLVYNVSILAPDMTIPIPDHCQSDISGITQFNFWSNMHRLPEIFLTVEGIADKFGRPLSGYRADPTPQFNAFGDFTGDWTVNLVGFSNENFCSTVQTFEISPGNEVIVGITPIRKEEPRLEYRRISIRGTEFGFPVLISGQDPQITCVEFSDQDGNALIEGENYPQIYVLDSDGNPIVGVDSEDRRIRVRERFNEVTDDFVDIYRILPEYGIVNAQIRCRS